jgi:predicted nucleic acid-binding protein
MVDIFLDVNKLVDLIKGDHKDNLESLRGCELMVSALSWHITYYLMRWKVPNKKLEQVFDSIKTVEMSNAIVKKAMNGPTNDFEDNIQLHSAIEGECDYFLTMDKKLLKMKRFGNMKICNKMD